MRIKSLEKAVTTLSRPLVVVDDLDGRFDFRQIAEGATFSEVVPGALPPGTDGIIFAGGTNLDWIPVALELVPYTVVQFWISSEKTSGIHGFLADGDDLSITRLNYDSNWVKFQVEPGRNDRTAADLAVGLLIGEALAAGTATPQPGEFEAETGAVVTPPLAPHLLARLVQKGKPLKK